MMVALRIGALQIIHPKYDPDQVLVSIRDLKPTYFPAVPTVFVSLLNHPKVHESGLERVRLMNDFEATAFGVIGLEAAKLATIQVGQPSPHGNIAVIGAGTGLGEALIVPLEASKGSDPRRRWHVVEDLGYHFQTYSIVELKE